MLYVYIYGEINIYDKSPRASNRPTSDADVSRAFDGEMSDVSAMRSSRRHLIGRSGSIAVDRILRGDLASHPLRRRGATTQCKLSCARIDVNFD